MVWFSLLSELLHPHPLSPPFFLWELVSSCLVFLIDAFLLFYPFLYSSLSLGSSILVGVCLFFQSFLNSITYLVPIIFVGLLPEDNNSWSSLLYPIFFWSFCPYPFCPTNHIVLSLISLYFSCDLPLIFHINLALYHTHTHTYASTHSFV